MKELKQAYLIATFILAGIFVISSIAFAAPTFNILGNYAGVGVNSTGTANANFTVSGTVAIPNLPNAIIGTDGNGKLVATTTSAGGSALSTSSATSTGYFANWVGDGLLSIISNLWQSSSTGNIGIGTTNPSSKLEIQGGNLVVGGTATSTITGDGASNILANVSSTNLSATGFGIFPNLFFTNASGTNISVSGFGIFPSLFSANASGTNESLTGFLQVGGGITQSGGANSIASTTINGQATSTSLSVTGITSALGSFGSDGALSEYAGSACTTGSLVTSVSATGAVTCNTTSSILTGYSTSTGANPTATIEATATNGTANTFMRSDGSPALGSQFASSSVTFAFVDATTTKPYSFLKWQTNRAITLAGVTCDEYAAATTTIEIYKVTANATTTNGGTVVASLACGIGGGSTTSLSTTALAYRDFLLVNTTSTQGTPTLTTISVHYLVN